MNDAPGTTSSAPLEVERRFFSINQQDWKAKFPGKFVLVKGESLVNTFSKPEDAVSAGLQTFGTEPFLVRSVDQTEQGVFIPALAFGILRMDRVAA